MNDFVVTSTITYRPHRIPPRCRVARPVVEDFTHEFRIPSVTSDEAPVVALVPDDRGYLGAPVGEEAALRGYDGRLYFAERNGRTPVKAGTDAFRAKRSHESWQAGQYEAIREAGKGFVDVLIVDGEVWKPTVEPAYAIVTMGMGRNHGGTYLEIDYGGQYPRRFPLTDYDNAIEAAVNFAIKRGDTDSIANIRKAPKATVLDPGAFKVISETEKKAAAEAEIRALAEQARELLAGSISWLSLAKVKGVLDRTDAMLSQAGIDELPALTQESKSGPLADGS